MRKHLRIFCVLGLINLLSLSPLSAFEVPIIQPGAPGSTPVEVDAETAIDIANTSHTAADAEFMQGMIIHHHQALIMSRLAAPSTNNQEILDLAGRIDVSQEDEISFMQEWLKEREEKAPNPGAGHNNHAHHKMIGMASPEEMDQLAKSKSTDFDRLFLQLMIAHHDGALEMVKDLKKFSGAAYDPILNEFVSDLVNDQGVEIERMNTIAVGLSDDPRSGLAHGLYTADEAILNLELIASLRKPTGFYDPTNPTGKGSEDLTEDNEGKTTAEISRSLRSPMLSFSNTDMAFRDDLLVAGSYHG